MNRSVYRHYVNWLALKKEGTPIYNSSIGHASIVIENLFSKAKKEIDILSGDLNSTVYGNPSIVYEAEIFLKSSVNHNLRIILERDSSSDRTFHPFFRMCKDLPNVKLRIASKKIQQTYDFHFIVMDDSSYRFESDKAKPAAIAAFGHQEGAENLGRVYEELWSLCKEADIIASEN